MCAGVSAIVSGCSCVFKIGVLGLFVRARPVVWRRRAAPAKLARPELVRTIALGEAHVLPLPLTPRALQPHKRFVHCAVVVARGVVEEVHLCGI